MKRIPMTLFLRRALTADAIASAAMGLLLLSLPGTLSELFNLTRALQYVGVFLVAYSAFVGWLALRPRPAAALVWTIIVGNVIWVAGSLVMLASAWIAPNALGYAFVVAQALAVGVFAELQLIGVRRTATPLTAAG